MITPFPHFFFGHTLQDRVKSKHDTQRHKNHRTYSDGHSHSPAIRDDGAHKTQPTHRPSHTDSQNTTHAVVFSEGLHTCRHRPAHSGSSRYPALTAFKPKHYVSQKTLRHWPNRNAASARLCASAPSSGSRRRVRRYLGGSAPGAVGS